MPPTIWPVRAAHAFPVLPLPHLPSDPVMVKLCSPQKDTEAKLSAEYGLEQNRAQQSRGPGEAGQPCGGDKARSGRQK